MSGPVNMSQTVVIEDNENGGARVHNTMNPFSNFAYRAGQEAEGSSGN